MNALDWIILVIMLLSALLAAAQGFFFEVICLAGAVVGYLAGGVGIRKDFPVVFAIRQVAGICGLGGLSYDFCVGGPAGGRSGKNSALDGA